jgi:MoaA/NifB/PqqE/SkfB family radical SAM enzyme
MSIETFRNVLKYGDEALSLGGGEPTLHPLFWQMLGEAIACVEYPWLATNGSQTNTALALAAMAQKGVIGCALSRDIHHDPIDERVVKAFTRKNSEYGGFDNRTPDGREIRDVTGQEINGGRCDFGNDTDCICPDFVVEPDGTVRGCECANAPVLGNVNSGFTNPDWWLIGECSKNQEYEPITTE